MTPTFAIVGHPNKGKSSIVATLAHDDAVAISPQSGTTRVNESITVRVGNSEYVLVDTPGFQRPGKVLGWLQQRAQSADQRKAAVAAFVNDAECAAAYPDEVQLLTPIVAGASILYVVDGSRPYGLEYESEMEILRWTGQASMALINPIENENHVEAWTQALGQYFRVVKVFNPMQADYSRQLSILETFRHLKEEWAPAIEQLLIESQRERQLQQERSIANLVDLLSDLCGYQVTQKVLNESQASKLKPILEKTYFQWMKQREAQAFDALKGIYQYQHLESSIFDLPFQDNLFDTEQWIAWGLGRKQLAAAAAVTGAAAGAVIDAGLGGASLFIGALGGGVLAGGSAWLGANRLADYRLMGLPMGGYEARYGPIRSRNFPYVVLGRYLFLDRALKHRNHARRERLEIREGDLAALLEQLDRSQLRNVHTALDKLRRQKPVVDLAEVLRPLFT